MNCDGSHKGDRGSGSDGKPAQAMLLKAMESNNHGNVDIAISLAADQAILLLDLLSRWSDENGVGETPSAACFQSTAEAAVLNTVCAALEAQLSAPFNPDYELIVAESRETRAKEWTYPTLRG